MDKTFDVDLRSTRLKPKWWQTLLRKDKREMARLVDKRSKFIDVWWLADDGGLSVAHLSVVHLLPFATPPRFASVRCGATSKSAHNDAVALLVGACQVGTAAAADHTVDFSPRYIFHRPLVQA